MATTYSAGAFTKEGAVRASGTGSRLAIPPLGHWRCLETFVGAPGIRGAGAQDVARAPQCLGHSLPQRMTRPQMSTDQDGDPEPGKRGLGHRRVAGMRAGGGSSRCEGPVGELA